jgi:hypothetical protein
MLDLSLRAFDPAPSADHDPGCLGMHAALAEQGETPPGRRPQPAQPHLDPAGTSDEATVELQPIHVDVVTLVVSFESMRMS